MWDWKGVLYYGLLENQMIHSTPIRPTERSTRWKASRISQQKCIIFHQVNVKTTLCLYGKTTIAWMEFWFIHCFHQTPYFDFHLFYSQNFSGKNFRSLKSVKGLNGSWTVLLKKIKSFGKTELWSCLKSSRRQWNKTVNTLFNKVLVKMKTLSLFYLKLKELFDIDSCPSPAVLVYHTKRTNVVRMQLLIKMLE